MPFRCCPGDEMSERDAIMNELNHTTASSLSRMPSEVGDRDRTAQRAKGECADEVSENHDGAHISDDGVIGDNWGGQSAHTYMSFRSSGSSHIYEDIDENGSSAEYHRSTHIDMSPDFHHSNTDNPPVEDASVQPSV